MTNIAMAMENGRVIAHLPIENAGFPSFFLCLRGYLKLGGSPHFTKWVITPVLYMGKVRLIHSKNWGERTHNHEPRVLRHQVASAYSQI